MNVAPAPAPFPAAALHNEAAGKIGLLHVDVPGAPHPVWLRAGTADAADCANFLPNFAARLQLDYQPRRILEIGAGAGYRALALAVAYPDAQILACEADPTYRRAALLNTLPYRNINFISVAPGDAPRRFAFTGRDGAAGHVVLAEGDGATRVAPLPEILATQGWDSYDTVIFNPDATSAALLGPAWPQSVRRLAIFTGGAALPGGAAAQLGEPDFAARQDGRYWFISRHAPAVLSAPAPAPIFDPSGPVSDIALVNVSNEAWGFFPIGAHGFRLHPNRGAGPAARLILSGNCHGHTRLTARLRLGHAMSAPVNFTISVSAEPEGAEIFRAQQTVQGGEELTLSGNLAPYIGPCRVTFATKMASMAARNDCAWAEFIDPVFE